MTEIQDTGIRERYNTIKQKVAEIAQDSGRKKVPEIIAVSKKHPLSSILEAIDVGITVFGENRIQEAIEKFTAIEERKLPFELHHIGPLQTGTLKKLFPLFQATHGAGTIHSILELLKVSEKNKLSMKYFIQVNLTGEKSKSGMEKKELVPFLQNLVSYQNEYCIPVGLMTMGPTSQDEKQTRDVFRELRQIRDEYFPEGFLSMGMSGDFQIAIEEGSDYLRIGTAIFGERE